MILLYMIIYDPIHHGTGIRSESSPGNLHPAPPLAPARVPRDTMRCDKK